MTPPAISHPPAPHTFPHSAPHLIVRAPHIYVVSRFEKGIGTGQSNFPIGLQHLDLIWCGSYADVIGNV